MIQNNKMLTKLRSPKDKQITHSAFLIQITILKKNQTELPERTNAPR